MLQRSLQCLTIYWPFMLFSGISCLRLPYFILVNIKRNKIWGLNVTVNISSISGLSYVSKAMSVAKDNSFQVRTEISIWLTDNCLFITSHVAALSLKLISFTLLVKITMYPVYYRKACIFPSLESLLSLGQFIPPVKLHCWHSCTDWREVP